jgi:hypothetical protein
VDSTLDADLRTVDKAQGLCIGPVRGACVRVCPRYECHCPRNERASDREPGEHATALTVPAAEMPSRHRPSPGRILCNTGFLPQAPRPRGDVTTSAGRGVQRFNPAGVQLGAETTRKEPAVAGKNLPKSLGQTEKKTQAKRRKRARGSGSQRR